MKTNLANPYFSSVSKLVFRFVYISLRIQLFSELGNLKTSVVLVYYDRPIGTAEIVFDRRSDALKLKVPSVKKAVLC